jgi:RimJ/RimL family protein N-acetyltransferase
VIETERLRLRDYHENERDQVAALNADPEVGAWLGGVLDRAQSDAMFDRVRAHIAQRGYGLWAAERKSDSALIGIIGLNTIPSDLPLAPGIEMSWRLFPHAWGAGYASEGAAAALTWGLAHIDTPEIVAFTTPTNTRSQAIMRRIGMARAPARDFEHPRLAVDHPLRSHVVYVASADLT